MYQGLLGHPGDAIEFTDRFYLSDALPDVAEQQKIDADTIGFVNFRDRIRDLYPLPEDFGPGLHPFHTQWVRRRRELMFNITALVKDLTEEFARNGGRREVREFHSPADFAELPQPVLLHCTGYAARTLFGDDSLTPVRGQVGWLIPEPAASYGLYYENLGVLSRRDGVVVQWNERGEASGWNNASETPDRAEAEEAIRQLEAIYAGMRA